MIFSTDLTDISSCMGIGIGYKSIVKLNICAQPMHQIFVINIVSVLKLVYQNENGSEYGFHDDSFQVWKSHCLLKSSVPLLWQLNLIKTLATGAISKLTIQRREPVFPHTPSSILFTYWGDDISSMIYVSLTNYFVMVFTNCGRWLGWNIVQRIVSR